MTEKADQWCPDSGKCHHDCDDECFRSKCCEMLSIWEPDEDRAGDWPHCSPLDFEPTKDDDLVCEDATFRACGCSVPRIHPVHREMMECDSPAGPDCSCDCHRDEINEAGDLTVDPRFARLVRDVPVRIPPAKGGYYRPCGCPWARCSCGV